MYVYNVQVYEPLIYLGSDYTLKPGLATRWDLQPDGKTWRFTLRQGVTFHDGTPFTTNLRLPEQIVHPEGAIVKANTHNDTPPYAGTGPWKYESYTPKQT